jgi:Flp pilus assembly protein TadG
VSAPKPSSLPRFSKAWTKLRRLSRDNSAVALVEFAFAAPLVLGMGMMGTETAYFSITHMQVSQLAMQVADNASRVGESQLAAQVVTEDDINGVLVGAEKLGQRLDIFENGRVIISSLQQNGDGGQWIAWQRCRGAKQVQSDFGVEGTGSSGKGFDGMGNPSNPITASSGTAVIFVEVFYDYDPITPFEFFGATTMNYTAAFNIRDIRDLSGLQQTTPASPVSGCNVFSANRPV